MGVFVVWCVVGAFCCGLFFFRSQNSGNKFVNPEVFMKTNSWWSLSVAERIARTVSSVYSKIQLYDLKKQTVCKNNLRVYL